MEPLVGKFWFDQKERNRERHAKIGEIAIDREFV